MAVRLEKVVLDLEDRFAGGMVKDAAAVALLRRELDNLSGTAVRTSRSTTNTERDIDRLGSTSERSGRSIDKLSGRLELFTAALGAVGPAAVPIGALAVPAVAGLANQFGIAALAAGTLIGSMQGIGDAVKKLEVARTAPTDASIEAARVAMSKLSTEGQDFARTLQGFLPTLRAVRDAGGAGWFPGLTDALQQIEKLAPRVENLFYVIGQAGGDIARDSAISLTSKRWTDFFDFLGREAPPIMKDLASITGDLAHGLAELWMAFTPTNNAFSSWMTDAADSFDKWASGLSKTQGFQEFVAYIQQNGPLVGEALGNIGNALLQIIEAAAPLGGPTLQALAAIADVIAKIADSDLGTPLVALFQVTSIMKLLGTASATSFGQIVTGQKEATLGFTKLRASARAFATDMKSASSYGYMGNVTGAQTASVGRLSEQSKMLAKQGALLGGVALMATGASDKMGLTNTTMGVMAGTIAGPWGMAVGGAIGLAKDLAAKTDGVTASTVDYKDSIEQVNAATLEQARAGQINTAQLVQQAKVALAVAQALPGGDVGAARAALAHAEALDRVTTSERYAAEASGGLYRQYQLETQALNDNIEAMRTKRAEAARGLNAELDYKASLLDAADALKTNGKSVNENTRAGQANLRALYGIATAWNSQDDATKNAQGSLKEARANFIKTAEAMGMGEDKAKRLAKALFEIPPSRTTKINLETDVAMQRARAIAAELDSITRPRNIEIYAHLHAPNASGFGAQVGAMADGGTVPKIPGRYRDYRLTLLAGGEQVITNRNGQADQFRRDRAAGRIPAYASGGEVMRHRYDTGWSTRANSGPRHTERIVEHLPKTIVLRSDALGDVVIDTVDDRIHAHARREEEQARG